MQIAPSRLPIHLIPKTLLSEVPKSIYDCATTAALSPRRGRFLQSLLKPTRAAAAKQKAEPHRFKIGGWINLPVGFRQPVSLLLIYCDGSGEQAILIDEMEAMGASEVLLSGEVEINSTRIESMSIYCGGIDDKTVWANNLSINRIDEGVEAGTTQNGPADRIAS